MAVRDIHKKHHQLGESCIGLTGVRKMDGYLEVGWRVYLSMWEKGCHHGFWEHPVRIVFVDNPWKVCEKRTQK